MFQTFDLIGLHALWGDANVSDLWFDWFTCFIGCDVNISDGLHALWGNVNVSDLCALWDDANVSDLWFDWFTCFMGWC
jgi:hypothetical protein